MTVSPIRLPRWGLQISERRVILLVGDVLAAGLATALALWLWSITADDLGYQQYLQRNISWFAVLIPLWLLLLYNSGLYELQRAAAAARMLPALLGSAGIALVLYLGVFFFAPRGLLPRLVFVYFIGGAFSIDLLWRLAYINILVRGLFRRRALVVGTGPLAHMIVAALDEFSEQQYDIAGFVDDGPPASAVGGLPVVGTAAGLWAAVQQNDVAELILAVPGELPPLLFRELMRCQEKGIDIVRAQVLYEQISAQVPVRHLPPDWVMTSFVDAARLNNLARMVRRVADVLGALLGLTLLALLLPLLAPGIYLESGSPIIFRQLRIGQGGRLFTIFKFRSMRVGAESDGAPRWAELRDPRVTRVGRFLRRTRLDEFPQFWNVLRGEMALVGPRPERPEFVAELEQKIPLYRLRLRVKPGLTGWAQINFGYGASVEDSEKKLQYDLYYIKQRGPLLDLVILFRTIGVMFGFRGR